MKEKGADQRLQVPALADPIPQLMLSYTKKNQGQVADVDVTDSGFSGPRIPFCAAGVLWGRVTFFRELF